MIFTGSQKVLLRLHTCVNSALILKNLTDCAVLIENNWRAFCLKTNKGRENATTNDSLLCPACDGLSHFYDELVLFCANRVFHESRFHKLDKVGNFAIKYFLASERVVSGVGTNSWCIILKHSVLTLYGHASRKLRDFTGIYGMHAQIR